MPLVSTMLFLPAALAVVVAFFPRGAERAVRAFTLGGMLLGLGLAAALVHRFQAGAGMQLVERAPWVEAFGIEYHVGVDGINIVLVLLHAICSYTGVLISYAVKERVKEYYLFYLTLITGVFGVFLSLDVFFFYFFYEMAVIPMYPLIGIWGSAAKPSPKSTPR